MGNGIGREDGESEIHIADGYSNRDGSRTAPGAPGAFSEIFATQLTEGHDYKLEFDELEKMESDEANDIKDQEDDNIVPTVFRWEHGGRQVFITGTFNNWEKQIPMHRSGNDFTYIHDLKKGKHAFKFIVDDEWRYAPDQPTVADIEGRVNNFIDVTDFKAYSEDDSLSHVRMKVENEEFSQHLPDIDEYTKEPPLLPPHLRSIVLNPKAHQADSSTLPVPQHVSINHLYCTAIKDGLMILGMTQRYKHKFVTTVFYSRLPG